MKTLRKKTGKKKGMLREQDEFLSLSQKALRYAQEHTKQVYIALGAAAVVVVLTILVSMLFDASQKRALAKEDEALKYYDINSPAPGTKPMTPAERLTKARDLFKEIVDKQGSGPAAAMALYYKANADMEVGDMDAAIDGYKKFLEKYSADPVMAALVNKRLAEAYQAKGRQQDAMEAYMKIAKGEGGYLKDEALFRLAKAYEGMGKKDEALAEYKAIEKDFPNSPFVGDARRKIALITGVPEAPMPLGPGAPNAPFIVTPGGAIPIAPGGAKPNIPIQVPFGKAPMPPAPAAGQKK